MDDRRALALASHAVDEAAVDLQAIERELEVGSFIMCWNPRATNRLFAPGEVGMWEAPDRSMTWKEGEEGVETDAQVQALRVAGCSHLQGYHLSRPVAGPVAIELAHGGITPAARPATGTHGG